MAKCSLCEKRKAKRKCNKHETMICPLCCAETRNEKTCSQCSHFTTSKKYLETKKTQKDKKKHFLMEIDQELDDAVDDALALIEKGRIQQGRKALNKLDHTHPNNHMVQFGLGVSYVTIDEYKKGISYFEKAVTLFPNFIDAYFNLAVAYQKILDIKNMALNLKKVTKIGDPQDSVVKNAQALLSKLDQQSLKENGINLKQYIQGEEIFEKAYEKLIKTEWLEAKKGFEQVLAIHPKHTQSLGNLGLCYSGLEEQEKALQYFDKALKLDPNYEPALLNKQLIKSLPANKTIENIAKKTVQYYKDELTVKNNKNLADKKEASDKKEKKSFFRNILHKILKRH